MVQKAAILAIGTELTSGEVLNTNGAWLGDKLEDLGFLIHSQVVVPDERVIIHQALTWLSQNASLILITGGLGPTSDDFTREVLAKWGGQPLEFNQQIWQQMNELYQQRGLNIRQAHRQQCYFPQQSKILTNHVGTAHGFVMDVGLSKLIILPGPPNEIQGMWDLEVAPLLQILSPVKTSDLKIWTCLGATESEMAEVTEAVIQDSGLKVGYRATIPYVKVKLWLPRGDEHARKIGEKLELSLAPWIVAHDREDPLDFLLQELDSFAQVTILDRLTKGQLCTRLEGRLGRADGPHWPNQLKLITSSSREGALPATDVSAVPNAITLWLNPGLAPQNFEVGLKIAQEEQSEHLRLPFKLQVDSRRGALYLTEIAIKWWRFRCLIQNLKKF